MAQSKTTKKVKRAIKEVFKNKPSTLDRSKPPKEQRKQLVAIGLKKAGVKRRKPK